MHRLSITALGTRQALSKHFGTGHVERRLDTRTRVGCTVKDGHATRCPIDYVCVVHAQYIMSQMTDQLNLPVRGLGDTVEADLNLTEQGGNIHLTGTLVAAPWVCDCVVIRPKHPELCRYSSGRRKNVCFVTLSEG